MMNGGNWLEMDFFSSASFAAFFNGQLEIKFGNIFIVYLSEIGEVGLKTAHKKKALPWG